MDPKELKALLKEAKDGIKSKDYATTIKNCKTIMKKEPGHYQANLYLGTAMKEQGKWQQAIECYKKATEIDPNQVYAWQGIILTYEKQGIKAHKDLLDAYKRVATFFEKDDKQKYIESTKKLANVLISQEDKKGALKVITRLSKSVGVDMEVAAMIVLLLNGTTWNIRTPEQNDLYSAALETIVTESPQPGEDTCKKFFTQINRAGDYAKVISQALSMRDKWNTYYSPMEWLCRYYIEDRLDEKTLGELGPFDVLTDRLFKLYPSSTFGHFARGKFLIDSGFRMSDGFIFVKTGLESNYNPFSLLVLIGGRLKFGDFEGAYADCQAGLRNFEKDGELCKKLKLYAQEALIWIDEKKAAENLEKLKEDFKSNEDLVFKEWLLLLEARLYAKKLDFEKLRGVIPSLDEANVTDWRVSFYRVLLSMDLNSQESIAGSIDGQIAFDMDNLDLLFEAATVLFHLKVYEKAGELFLKMTENPKGAARPLPWKYLGLLYSMQENVQLAAKCFKKAYNFSPSADVGSLLSDAYFTLGDEQQNMNLLIEATKHFGKQKSKWAWLRLGVLYLNNGSANEAVNAFQAAIRADTNDCHVWESLADAYFLRGSYSAALSTYNKALSLGCDPMYPKLKIGVVHQCLGQQDESISALKNLLKEYPNNTPVLVELAKTFSLIAQEMSGENFDNGAKKAVESALEYSVLAIKNSPKRILLPWKMIGDSPLILANIPGDVMIKVPCFLLGEIQTETDGSGELQFKQVTLDKFKEIGTKALFECLQVINSQESEGEYSKNITAYIYHQLALSYFNRARTARGERKNPEFFQKALVCVKKAVAAHQGNHMYWNTLGVITFFTGNEELSQHSFIKSMQLESNNVTACCNLGFLYLKHKKERLAHQMFNKAQSIAPLYAYSWVGQGLVAEMLEPKEAPDLFRHAAHLELIPFGVSCYADWVCRLMLKEVLFKEEDFWFSILRVDAVTIVNDLMTRVEHRYENAHLFNLKGITSALNGFYDKALESFTKALDLNSMEDPLFPVSPAERNKIVLNRITILAKMGRYDEAREELLSVGDLGAVGSAVGALVMRKLGYFDNSETLYGQLLESLTDESEKVDGIIGLGLLYNESKGPEAACAELLQDSMVKSPYALLALSAIGIMNSDTDFLCNVMEPLDKFKGNVEFMADIGLMKACFFIMNGNSRQGMNELLKLIRLHPLNGQLWSMLSQIIFSYQLDMIPSSTCQNVTLTALKLGSMKGKSKESSMTSKSSAMISLCHLMDNDWKTAKVTALKGIRKYPEERENWVVLACAFWYQFTEEKSTKIYQTVVKLLEKEVTICRVSDRALAWSTAFLQLIQQFKV